MFQNHIKNLSVTNLTLVTMHNSFLKPDTMHYALNFSAHYL